MEKFLEFISNFLTKHLTPTLLSIIGVAIFTFYLPATSPVRVKLGDTLFYLSIFSFIFVIVSFVIWLFNKIIIIKRNLLNKKQIEEELQKHEQDILDNYMATVDCYMPSERKIIEDFLTTDNKPIPAHVIVQASHVNGHRDFYNKPLFMSEWLDKTYLHTNDKYIEYAKLIPRVFEALSTCMKTRGTISHFETEF